MNFSKDKFICLENSKTLKVGDILFEEIKYEGEDTWGILFVKRIYKYQCESNICIDVVCYYPKYGFENHSYNTNFIGWSSKVYKHISHK